MSLSAEQIAVRRTAIGSSEIAALVGLDPYRNAMDVFLDKVYGYRKKRTEEMEYGSHVEPGILSYRRSQLGAYQYREADFVSMFEGRILAFNEERTSPTIRSAESSLAVSTVDAIFSIPVRGEDGAIDDGEDQVEEAKFVSWHQSAEWGEEDGDSPANYQIQCQWHMGVTGIHRAELVAEVGAPASAWAVPWRPTVYENLLIVAERFWRDNIVNKVRPLELDSSDAAAAYLRNRYPRELHGVLPNATPEVEALSASYAWLTQQIGTLEDEKEATRNRLCELLGDNAGAVLSDGRRVTWLWQLNGKKPPTRVLRVSKGK